MTIEEFELSLKDLTIAEFAGELIKFYAFINALAVVKPKMTVEEAVNSFLNPVT